ncbi:KPN_02809 family neutral zinc metallopeptidase [Catalinimonas niigatensis]|uniref:KPN_02809 family neutral zinc metallopeptidase n=1 Tax=Catalinimonas niigatensis TaxID=1397264 RepID=UPI0026653D8F|nr:neutral zinc metallopeptidase [Catalinimonas niigatensis]WPP51712.1 neutral zinc metallopeptidase [Catalinimonas niigatensis]
MRWKGRRQSTNVDDRRGSRGKTIAVGGGLGTVVLIVLSLLFGGDPSDLINVATQQSTTTQAPSAEENELAEFVTVVLADTEDVWNQVFQQQGRQYQEPTLVLFSGSDQSACGSAQAATGPFYCPADQQVYIDLSFQQTLSQRLGAGGDFAMAYVVAHEVGHHVQNLLGISRQVQSQRNQLSEAEYNRLSVKLELQADFFAGLWAHHADQISDILQEGDIEEALNAANAIGDDRLQKQSQGQVVPDAFTHGTSEQRMRWFKKGYETGDINQGDTFNATNL